MHAINTMIGAQLDGQWLQQWNRTSTLKKDIHHPQLERVRGQEAKREPGNQQRRSGSTSGTLSPLKGLIDTTGPLETGEKKQAKGIIVQRRMNGLDGR